MGNVYDIDKDKNLILYSTGVYVCFRSSSGEMIARPVILANDYKDNLSDIIYKGNLYYCYQNTQSDIIIKSITDMNELYKLSSKDTPDCFEPRITVIDETLLLFYFVKNPVDDTYCLKCLLPFEKDKSLVIEQSFTSLPQMSTIINPKKVLLNIYINDNNVTFEIDNQLNVSKLIPEKKLLNQEDKKISRLKQEIKNRDELIESIKNQYNELMDTANQYRNEAIKWRSYVINPDSTSYEGNE